MRELAREELRGLEAAQDGARGRLKDLLVPRDPLADKNTIMEIRAGTGGDEAALFAADLFRMYSALRRRPAAGRSRSWSASETELGGFREIVFSVTGDAVYERPALGVGRAPRPARARHRGLRAASTRAPSPWPSSPRWRRPRSTSATRTSAST